MKLVATFVLPGTLRTLAGSGPPVQMLDVHAPLSGDIVRLPSSTIAPQTGPCSSEPGGTK